MCVSALVVNVRVSYIPFRNKTFVSLCGGPILSSEPNILRRRRVAMEGRQDRHKTVEVFVRTKRGPFILPAPTMRDRSELAKVSELSDNIVDLCSHFQWVPENLNRHTRIPEG